ncbi:family 15 carbohydrate-binding domain-containing protein [Alteromonadaceae bacterium BrNp21-10]|nr:family 15 carbohydrate-binding domain-containing protein [Alteromonadaceae bacterium BrNp21-10]
MKNSNWLRFIGLCSVLVVSACSLEMEDEEVGLGKYTAPTSDSTPGSTQVDIGDSTFDDGSTGLWTPSGSATLISEQNVVHAGNYSLKVSGRTAVEDGGVVSLGEQLIVGNSYTISAWVRLASGDAPVSDITKLVLNYSDENGDNVIVIKEATAADSKWIKVSGRFVYESVGTVTSLPTLSITGPESSHDFYIDTVTVTDHGADSDEVAPINISVASGWRVSAGELVYTTDGASYQPTVGDQQLVFDLVGPIDLSAAEIVFTYKVDQAYIDSGSDVQPFAQDKQSWSGHWGCYIGNGDLPAADEEGTYSCTFDNAAFNLTDETMGIQIGVQAKGGSVGGTLTITGVSIILPAVESNDISADMSSGWRASNEFEYTDDGVSFQPTADNEQIVFDLVGPLDLSASEVIFAYKVDQAYIDSGADLQPFAQTISGTGQWDCYIGNGNLPDADTETSYTCALVNDDFNLLDDTMGIKIGIQAKGSSISGRVTVTAVDVIVPD